MLLPLAAATWVEGWSTLNSTRLELQDEASNARGKSGSRGDEMRRVHAAEPSSRAAAACWFRTLARARALRLTPTPLSLVPAKPTTLFSFANGQLFHWAHPHHATPAARYHRVHRSFRPLQRESAAGQVEFNQPTYDSKSPVPLPTPPGSALLFRHQTTDAMQCYAMPMRSPTHEPRWESVFSSSSTRASPS